MNQRESRMTRHDNVESPTERTSRNLFKDLGSVPGSESEWTIESIRERANTTSEGLDSAPIGSASAVGDQ